MQRCQILGSINVLARSTRRSCQATPFSRTLSTSRILRASVIPVRKQIKDTAQRSRIADNAAKSTPRSSSQEARLQDWELTVGIEIHAQVNTAHKLFSPASAEYTDSLNGSSWPFDIAVPGSQPVLQKAVLIPAIRAALALNCTIQPRSTFDRKHYFYHDQPAGYQITQYYNPFARDGVVKLSKQDGLASDENVDVGIKQIQLEQDTARSQEQDEDSLLIDFNRSGHALIEIISLPHIHSPEAAAAYVRKVQSILYAIDSATTGMEFGGLRADINVSVRRVDAGAGIHSYAGISGLGQRTEIKNLSSFRAVEDAVRAERDRQISVLSSGGIVESETRGWSLAKPLETRRLRGKEGEVDYRYMPDPDISPLLISPNVVDYLRETLPPLPQQLLQHIIDRYHLSTTDADVLVTLDDGGRLLYYQDVVARLEVRDDARGAPTSIVAGNWVLHELGAVLTKHELVWHSDLIKSDQMAELIDMQSSGQLTGTSAKHLLEKLLFSDESASCVARREGLLFVPMTDEEYLKLAEDIITENQTEAEIVRTGQKQARGKLKFLLGQMMRKGDRNRIEAQKAEQILISSISQAGNESTVQRSP